MTDNPPPAFQLTVYGTPGPQGSKKQKGTRITKNGNRIPRLIESSAKVKPWREAVDTAARIRIAGIRGFRPLDGPLMATMFFTLPRPTTEPGRSRPYPSVYPDLSKLLRSTEDALTTAGVWADDARVVRYRDTAKLYPGTAPVALDRPGVIIGLWQVTE